MALLMCLMLAPQILLHDCWLLQLYKSASTTSKSRCSNGGLAARALLLWCMPWPIELHFLTFVHTFVYNTEACLACSQERPRLVMCSRASQMLTNPGSVEGLAACSIKSYKQCQGETWSLQRALSHVFTA